ncbi:9407_t:CDS:2 [Gigaspora rosea]|nr:9407_t:CDS:2 [Gigaspora rosea]
MSTSSTEDYDNIYISDPDGDNFEIELDEEEIVESIQNMSFEKAISMNKDNLEYLSKSN